MDFLKDPRFSLYRSSTTMKKNIPSIGVEELSAQDNVIYKLIKSSEPTMHEKHSILKEQQVTRQKAHRTTIQTTNSRFLLHKTSQRLSTINSFFSNPSLANHSPSRQHPTKQQTQNLRNQLYKLNHFTVSVERFQKSINRSSQKVNLLKSYNTIVGNYFQRFNVNEDRTRKEIVEHQEIVKLLLSKNSQDDNVAYFNVVREKKAKESGKKGRAKSSDDREYVIRGNGVEALALKEMSKVYGYQERCEERVMAAIEELRRCGVLGRKVNHMEKVSRRQKTQGCNEKDKMKESRFFKEKTRKSTEEDNKENHIKNSSNLNPKQPPLPTRIKKGSIIRLKHSIFNRQRPSFITTSETFSSLNQTDSVIKETISTIKEQIHNDNDKPFRRFQKRLKTAEPLDNQEGRQLIEKKLSFNKGW